LVEKACKEGWTALEARSHVRMEQGKQHVPDWLFGTLPHEWFFSTWKELENYILHINCDEQIDLKDRWKFFNHENLSIM
jgi:hypothetical protein